MQPVELVPGFALVTLYSAAFASLSPITTVPDAKLLLALLVVLVKAPKTPRPARPPSTPTSRNVRNSFSFLFIPDCPPDVGLPVRPMRTSCEGRAVANQLQPDFSDRASYRKKRECAPTQKWVSSPSRSTSAAFSGAGPRSNPCLAAAECTGGKSVGRRPSGRRRPTNPLTPAGPVRPTRIGQRPADL